MRRSETSAAHLLLMDLQSIAVLHFKLCVVLDPTYLIINYSYFYAIVEKRTVSGVSVG